jgi:hypothetical protein
MNENAVSGDRPDTVLLVESEVLARLAISEYLRHCGYRVIEAASAKEDLTLLAEVYIAVDVVFSAVELGGETDGFAGTKGAYRTAGAQCHFDPLCCANIAPVATCQLVEASTDPDGGWHTEACHPVQHVASNFCLDLLTGQGPGEKSPSNDGFVPINRSLNEASSVVARTTLPADATMLFDGCNMLIALRRPTRTRNRCRPRWNDDVSPRMPIRYSVVDSLTIICAVCYHRCDRGCDLIKNTR